MHPRLACRNNKTTINSTDSSTFNPHTDRRRDSLRELHVISIRLHTQSVSSFKYRVYYISTLRTLTKLPSIPMSLHPKQHIRDGPKKKRNDFNSKEHNDQSIIILFSKRPYQKRGKNSTFEDVKLSTDLMENPHFSHINLSVTSLLLCQYEGHPKSYRPRHIKQ